MKKDEFDEEFERLFVPILIIMNIIGFFVLVGLLVDWWLS